MKKHKRRNNTSSSSSSRVIKKSLTQSSRLKASFSEEVQRIVADQEAEDVLDLSEYANQINDTLVSDICQLVRSKNPKKTMLNISGCNKITPVGARAIAHYIGGNLKTICASNTTFRHDHQILKVIGTGLEIVNTLNLSHSNVNTGTIRDILPSVVSTLTSLDLSHCPDLSDDALAYVAGAQGGNRGMRRLRVLNLAYSNSLGGTSRGGVAALGVGCHALEYINLQGVSKLSDGAISSLVAGTPKLRMLHLKSCPLITDTSLSQIGRYCPRLCSLNISGCVNITAVGIHALTSSCHNLESLCMEGCLLVTEDALTSLARNCEKIQYLNADGCQKITENGLKTLASHLPFVVSAESYRGLSPHVNANEIKYSIQRTTIRASAALIIQSWIRGINGRRRALTWRETFVLMPAAVVIQRAVRARAFNTRLEKRIQGKRQIDLMVSRIQARARGYLVRLHAYQQEVAEMEFEFGTIAAIKIQAAYRGVYTRRIYGFVTHTIMQLRRAVEAKRRDDAATKLQRAYRVRFARSRFEILMAVAARRRAERNDAAIKLQRCYRSRAARSITRQLKAIMEAQRQKKQLQIKYTIAVQARWRGYQSRKQLEAARKKLQLAEEEKINASIRINAGARGFFARRLTCKMREERKVNVAAAKTIQRAWRFSRHVPTHHDGILDKLVEKMSMKVGQEEEAARIKQKEILARQRLAANRDSASESESDEEHWAEFYTNEEEDEENGETQQGEHYWYSYSLDQQSILRPNIAGIGRASLGFECKVFWPAEDEWYPGKITRFNYNRKKHKITYDDGDSEWLVLSEEASRIQINNGYCWSMYEHYEPGAEAIKAGIFVELKVQYYSHEYFGWRTGLIESFHEGSTTFCVKFDDDSSQEWIDLYYYESCVQIQDRKSLEWYSMAEYVFGRGVDASVQDYLTYYDDYYYGTSNTTEIQ